MSPETLLDLAQEGLVLALMLSAPAVGGALLVGLLVTVLQTATQVQEPTLSVAARYLAVVIALVVAGHWMVESLTSFASGLFERIPGL